MDPGGGGTRTCMAADFTSGVLADMVGGCMPSATRLLELLGSATILLVCFLTAPPPARGQDEYVRAFTEKHFEGQTQVYTPLSDEADLAKFDNRIQSLIYRMPPGRVCMFYVDRGFQGAALELHGTGYPVRVSDLGLYSRNLTSMRWDATGGQINSPQSAFVRLYEGESFSGRRATVQWSQDLPNFRDMFTDEGRQGFDNSSRSVRWLIPEGWICILYRNPDFGGETVELRGTGRMESLSELKDFARQASSLRWVQDRGASITP